MTAQYLSRGIGCGVAGHALARWWIPLPDGNGEVAACDACHDAWQKANGIDVRV